MNARSNRREFLAGASRLAAGVATVAALPAWATAADKPGHLCLSCRDVHLKETGKTDCWSAMQSIGAEGVEANIGEDLSFAELFHPERKYSGKSDADIATLAADAKQAGLRIAALAMNNRFDDEKIDAQVEWAVKSARVAQALGTKAIRIDVVPRKMPVDQFLDHAVKVLKQVMAGTESTGVAFAIENHSKVTNDPAFLGPLLHRVGSPRLGITLDTGNFYWFGHPLSKVYELFERFAPVARHTHCKNIKYPAEEREKRREMGWKYAQYNCPIFEGDIDFHRLVKILRSAGYTGDLCVEDESLKKFPAAERGSVLAKEIALLKECQ
jgi:sugar phosphate isomerase/epimerase